MIWPYGNFFQAARAQSLQALTVGVKASPKGWVPLTEWRQHSSLAVVSADKNWIEISCNQHELRSSLVAEIEAWADHELEMRAQVLRAASVGSGAQDSWFLVSLYYWAVFSACLLLRLLGTPVFRMGVEDLLPLKQLSTAVHFPGEGSYKLHQLGQTSATSELVRLTRVKANYHQALWAAIVSSLASIQTATSASNSSGSERSMVSALLKGLSSAARLSDLRNSVNYRSELGFPSSLKGLGFSVLPDARTIEHLDSTRLLISLSQSADAVVSQASGSVTGGSARLMLWTAVTLSVLSQSLYEEVSSVVRFDRTWLGRRAKFGTSVEHGVPVASQLWHPVFAG